MGEKFEVEIWIATDSFVPKSTLIFVFTINKTYFAFLECCNIIETKKVKMQIVHDTQQKIAICIWLYFLLIFTSLFGRGVINPRDMSTGTE